MSLLVLHVVQLVTVTLLNFMHKEAEEKHSFTARSCVCTLPRTFFIEVISYT